MKTCKKCGNEKNVTEFRLRVWGYAGTCRECEKQASKENFYKNHDKYLSNSKLWKSNNKEKNENTKREWIKKNPDKVSEMNKRKYNKDPLKYIKAAVEWARSNPERKNAQIKNRKARILGNGGSYTAEEWIELKNKYNNTCLCCGKKEPEIKLTFDHVMPISKGGENTIENAQPLCLSCNSRKKDKHIDYRR